MRGRVPGQPGGRRTTKGGVTAAAALVTLLSAALILAYDRGWVDPGPTEAALATGSILIVLTALVIAGAVAVGRREPTSRAVNPATSSATWGAAAPDAPIPHPGPVREPAPAPRDRYLGGVATAIGERTGIDPGFVRIGFVVATVLTKGVAAIAYALAWGWLEWRSRRPDADAPGPLAGGIALLVAGFVLLLVLDGLGSLGWPLAIAAVGAGIIWASNRDGETSARGIASQYSGGFGIALVIGASLLFLASSDALGQTREVALGIVVFGVAISLILAPFLWRLGRNLAEERAERVRVQERAEMSAHLHDSVLQTLAMMQKAADDPTEVALLARRQERELRDWMAGDRQARGTAGEETLAAALEAAAAAVELDHRSKIDVVTVGDGPLDDRGHALVAATREALTNASKYGGDAPVSLFAEISGTAASVFVRDRGPGFDPDAIAADRHGVRDSIVARMERAGGTASIRSEAGFGTEVELELEEQR